jgi:hypothetical protein
MENIRMSSDLISKRRAKIFLEGPGSGVVPFSEGEGGEREENSSNDRKCRYHRDFTLKRIGEVQIQVFLE